MNILHSADWVVFYQVKLNPACPATGTSYKSGISALATDARLHADPGVTSLIPARSHTFVEIGHEFISMVILLSSADLFKKGCCQF